MNTSAAVARTAASEVRDGNTLVPPNQILIDRPAPAQDLLGSPTPNWEGVISNAYSTSMGYAYMVAKDGRELTYNAARLARSGAEGENPDESWNPLTTLMNLASVSKSITAFAIMTEVQRLKDRGILDKPFWPFIEARFAGIAPGAGVERVTVEDLLTMKSAMVPDGTLYPTSVDGFLRDYLQQPLVAGAKPGVTYAYSNTNFTILQVVYEALSGMPYVDGVIDRVFRPMGIAVDAGEMTTVPASTTEALAYRDRNDTDRGIVWQQIPCVGAGGWLAWPHGALQFLVGVRLKQVLSDANTDRMLKGELGWYRYPGKYGNYYHHNGGLVGGAQWIKTGIVHFDKGYDAVLFVNSDGPDPVQVLIDAFEAVPR
jgi:CubicO group peptidase (beta-lactamase class C family)